MNGDTADAAGSCAFCKRPVYRSSDPLTCNAGFMQDLYGPPGQGRHVHISCYTASYLRREEKQTPRRGLPRWCSLAFGYLLKR